MSRAVVITGAVTGAFGTKARNPALPVTPAEIADPGLEVGAAVVVDILADVENLTAFATLADLRN